MAGRILSLTFRHMLRNKGYAITNITGLGIGLAVSMLIGLWINNELSYNHHFSSPETLGRILSTSTFDGNVGTSEEAAAPLAAELRSRFPEDFRHVTAIANGIHSLSVGQNLLQEEGSWVEADFIPMFLNKGISPHALDDPGSVLISQSLATALFGKKTAAGQLIRLDNSQSVKVAGIFEDFPVNSRFGGLGLLLSWQDPANPGLTMDTWMNHHFNVFVQCRPGGDFDALSKKIALLSKSHLRTDWERLSIQSFTREHLYNRFTNGKEDGGEITYVRLFAGVALAVLLLASINFMNLSTARSEKRAKEVGVRKAIGSGRRQLMMQFYGESMLYVLCAAVLAILLVMASLGRFELLAQTSISFPAHDVRLWIFIPAFLIFTALLAGSYPAVYLSSFQPIKVLNRTFKPGKGEGLPRKIMVVTQFVVSMTLIFCTLAILRQIGYAKDRPVGYSRAGLLVQEMNTPEIHEHFSALRDELLRSGAVTSMEQSSSPATNVQNSMFGYEWEGQDPRTSTPVGTVFTGYDFGRTIGWKIKEGRDFLAGHPADSGAMILNETAVKYFGLKNPVGKVIRWHDSAHVIVGVVKDLVMESPYLPVQPTIFTISNLKLHLMLIRINPEKPLRAALETISGIYARYDPGSPFAFDFTDDTYAAKFADENRMAGITSFFALLAILISALGLFALASFVTEQRGKEIGIRKILGATVFRLWKMLTGEFVFLVLIAVAIAIPVGWYCSDLWLAQYAYRATLTPWIFALTALTALAVAVLTVGFHVVRAAVENPVKRLKGD